jgi:hypothetical protein
VDISLKLPTSFAEAELAADAGALRALLADDFRSIGERGFVLDKDQWIARHGDFRYLSLETSDVEVNRYDHAVIVRGIQRSRATWRGDELNLRNRFSQVWVEQSDGWRLAAVQFSSLDGD